MLPALVPPESVQEQATRIYANGVEAGKSSFLRWRPRREVLHHCLVHPHVNVKEYLENDPEAYTAKDEFLKPLTLIYNSLLDCGDTYIAHGRILDVIRQVQF